MPSTEWSYDAATSRSLRLLSHLPVAAFGGVFLPAAGASVAFVLADPGVLRSPFVLLVALLALVGGPTSLLYLWPMLADPDQRPTRSAFSGTDRSLFTARSVVAAAVAGALAVVALVAVGAPFEAVYGLVVGCVFSPILVAVATTTGQLDDGELTINRREVPLHRLTGVRSIRVRGVVVLWLFYAPRSGLFVPRAAAVPADAGVGAIRGALEAGIEADPELEPPDRAVQAVGVVMGALFLAFGAAAYVALDEPAVGLYVAAVAGGMGAFLCLLGIRGV
ncbi:uncharacterized protein Nmlp_1413 [Natronomonas moolapensis 8.8.11]|uniref:Uncharacterized protein n=1 Tax=Natronomonas moolapensis (strain DSM 18674 / CECT 7526 / JCM 14361 / 8.8.11) TaxID=268739 RepID=M1XNT4_NATM8|nr:hypothetical protein [Natronomonas moolapensis]CCQ35617.1 uncharacterized protein Nmlp_1413 [Natronomonas moolapensis 8.8.11]